MEAVGDGAQVVVVDDRSSSLARREPALQVELVSVLHALVDDVGERFLDVDFGTLVLSLNQAKVSVWRNLISHVDALTLREEMNKVVVAVLRHFVLVFSNSNN